MLKNNKINIVIAVIFAIALWVYVVVEVNPSSAQVTRNVPIQFVNEDRLNETGLAVLSCDVTTASVFYTGQRSDTSKLKADDFKVTIDLRGMVEGTNTVKIKVSGPDGVNIDTSNLQKVNVVVEKLVKIDVPITPKVINLADGESEPYIVKMSKDVVSVSGAKSLIDSIVNVRAELDAKAVGESVKAISCKLIPVDKNGEKISGVNLSTDAISIKTLMLSKKTVDLEVNVKEDDEAVARNVIIPETISIKGDTALLIGIDKIVCEDLDISNVYENCEIKLKPILPNGIEIASDSEELNAYIEVTNGMKKSFVFDENDVLVRNIPDGAEITLEELEFSVEISGLTSVVNAVTQADFKLTADYPEEITENGDAVLAIKVECEKVGIDNISINPEEIKCKITMSEI